MRHIFRPLILAFSAYIGLGAIAWMMLAPQAARWASGFGVSGWLGSLAASLLLIVVWVFLFSTLFVALAGVFGGFLWEKLAEEVEELDGGAAPAVKLSGGALATDSIARMFLAVFVGVAALIGALVSGPLAPVVGWAAAALLGLLDYTAPASLRRGRILGPQARQILRRSSVGFAAVVGVITLLPIINLLLWPVCVTGGTLLVRKIEK
jgi:uncharacterized protein involved in cysteine biosynthesis